MTKFPYVYPSKPARMPVSRNVLALRFRQNWMAKHPVDAATTTKDTSLDDSLTSLSWLQNLNIMKFTAPGPTPPSSPPPQVECANSDNNTQVNPNSVLNVLPQVKRELPINMMEIAPPTTASMDKIDYKTNPYVKPPYSYATLICMAMRETKKSKITLSGIYNWITENFMYYRMADPSWQNSIRHNLSLNKCFQKVARRKDEPGKGGFWRINPEFSDMFVNGIFKKRRGSTREPLISPTKKIKHENEFLSVCLDEIAQHVDHSGSMSNSSDLISAQSSLLQGIKTEDNVVLGDVNWNTFLNQDIEVGGIKIKTERLIDDTEGYAASPITSLSPPPSDNSSDIGLEELLGSTDLTQDYPDAPLDLTTGDALDLSISGSHITPPDWWSESMTRAFLSPEHNTGLHTPIATSPMHDHSHPWADDRTDIDQAFAAFDVDNLFDLGNIPSPRISEIS